MANTQVTLKAQVTIAANATATSDAIELPVGQIVAVQPFAEAGTPEQGQAFVEVQHQRTRPPTTSNLKARLWRGLLRDGGQPASIPMSPCLEGESFIFMAWTGSAWGSTGRIIVNVTVETDPAKFTTGGGYLHNEAPGSGYGTVRSIALANPAAGADYASVTVPAFVRWKLRGVNGVLVTDATVITRVPTLLLNDAANDYAAIVSVGQGALTTARHSWVRGVGSSQAPGTVGRDMSDIGDVELPEGHIIDFDTVNLQGGDDWAAGTLSVEEWVVPS